MRALLTFIGGFVCALALGLWSAWYMMAHGVPFATGKIGPWLVWYEAGNPQADPYTKAYLARSGRLPIISTGALYYHASSDEAGEPLDAACEYYIDGGPLNAEWWSLAAYDGTGRLIPNKAGRHSFNRSDIARQPDGSYRVVLGPTAQPGNWLPSGRSGPVRLLLRIYIPRDSDDALKGRVLERSLPELTKARCE